MTDEAIIARSGRVAVLMGGTSAERDISLKSGRAVCAALARKGVEVIEFDWPRQGIDELRAAGVDRVFIALHGRGGEDGTLQGCLQVLDLPYTGSGVLASALAMDKLRTKFVWQSLGVPTPDFAVAGAGDDPYALVAQLGLPLFVKPAREGSSFGISKVKRIEQLASALDDAARFDSNVLVERCIEGSEYTLGVLESAALPLIRLETPNEFYDFNAKYLADSTRYICPCGLPADVEQALAEQGLLAFDALDCHGWGRLDLMVDRAGKAWFIELNTVPGLTDHSLVPMAAAAAGIDFDRLAVRILGTSFHDGR
ncbi:MAG: D-alanine--D-alanine ligase [Gammaproteobacteria bacterium]|nr:D-alanine--D-alanine ligase [Gammaproteobacteria bacterium]